MDFRLQIHRISAASCGSNFQNQLLVSFQLLSHPRPLSVASCVCVTRGPPPLIWDRKEVETIFNSPDRGGSQLCASESFIRGIK